MNNVISTKVNVYRNVKDYKFTQKLSSEQKQEITQKLEEVFKNKLTLLNVASADAQVVKYLKTNNLILPKTANVFLSKSDSLCVNLFDDEHIDIIATADGYNKEVYAKAKEISELLASKISLSFNDEYGYLMSDISRIGAGLKCECEICLSSLKELNKIDQVKQNIRKLGYSLKETNKPCVYMLSTICNLGFSEKEIFAEFDKMVAKLQDLEVESAKMLDVTNHDVILDRSLRSLAILKSAYMLTYDELNKLLINLRTGVNLGMLNITNEQLIQLQKLTKNKTSEFISQTETKQLAENVKNILKGD